MQDLQRTENVHLTAVVSRTATRARAFATTWNIPRALTVSDELWEASDIDVIYIAAPHSEHFGLAKRAIEAGKHVVVEKPIGMNATEARKLAGMARNAGVFLMEAMWTCFNEVIVRVRDLVADGGIGEVRNVQASMGFVFPYEPANRMWNPELGGGTSLDQGVYTVTLASLFLGVPDLIVGRGRVLDSGVDAEASVLLGYAGGACALLSTAMTVPLPTVAAICGTGGQIALGPAFWAPTGFSISETGFPAQHFDLPLEGFGYVPMLRAASEAILDGRLEHELHPVAESIAVMEILDETRRQVVERSHATR